MDVHFPRSVAVAEESFPNNPWSNDTSETRSIDGKMVKRAFETFGKNKTPGPDGFSPAVLKQFPISLNNVIAHVYELCIHNAYTPKKWRDMKTIFLPKPGKEVYETAKSFRPICLSNFLLKALEKIIKLYILDNITANPLTNQHGFTLGKSCDSALSSSVDYIH